MTERTNTMQSRISMKLIDSINDCANVNLVSFSDLVSFILNEYFNTKLQQQNLHLFDNNHY